MADLNTGLTIHHGDTRILVEPSHSGESTDVSYISVSDNNDIASGWFTLDESEQMRDMLTALINDYKRRQPTNSQIIEALAPGSVFTLYENNRTNQSRMWFRTSTGQ